MNIDKARSINGWMSDIELEWLARTSRFCDVIVEFGSYLGRSTRAICDNTKAIVFAVDTWSDEYYNKNDKRINILVSDSYEQFNKNLSDHIESNQLKPLRCKSQEFPDYGRIVNFVFIDADHRYEHVKADIELAERLIADGGIIAGHDYGFDNWPGVKQAVDEIYPEAKKVGSIWWIQKR